MQSFEVIPISRISWNVQFDNVLQEPTRDPDVWPAPAPKDPQVSHELSSVWPSRSRFWPIHWKCPSFICILQGMGSSYTFCSSRLSWLWWCSSCKGAAEEHQVKNLGSTRSIWFGAFHQFFNWLIVLCMNDCTCRKILLFQRLWACTWWRWQECQGWRSS